MEAGANLVFPAMRATDGRKRRAVRAFQRLLGHSSVTTTQVYADVLAEDVKAGVEAIWREAA